MTSSAGTAARGARLTSLIGNELIARLERLRVLAWRKAANRGRGEQLAGRGGASIDFADYRDYAPGDDLRFVDWNIFSRLERPYLKLFRREEERHLVLVVDASRSMRSEGKGARARELAAAFAVMGLHANDLVSVWAVGGAAEPRRLAPVRGRAGLRRAFAALEAVGEDGAVPIEAALQTMLARHRGRGIAVVLSDFLTEGDLKRSLDLLYAAGLEPACVQILGPGELEPDLTGDLRLVDCETTGVLDVSAAGDLLAIYHEHRLAYQRRLAEWCVAREGRFLAISSAEDTAQVVGDTLRRKGWIG